MEFSQMSRQELQTLYAALTKKYNEFIAQRLQLNMSRGRPSPEQLDLCRCVNLPLSDFICENGEDVRNYSNLSGIPEARRLFGKIFGVPASQVLVGGSSSLNLMFDTICRAFLHGVLPDSPPWSQQGKVKFLCPVPGYDRHFAITGSFGIEMISVPMQDNGPDMALVEKLVAEDESVKGIWCVPIYSNPDGITYSDAVVRRFAAMRTAASDFRIFWDMAYCLHHLDRNNRDYLLNLYDECVKCGNEDRLYMFASTSKVTMAGSGISAMAMSPANFAWTVRQLSIQTICHDNVNQLRHLRLLPDLAAVESVMDQHAALLRPKFQVVMDALEKEVGQLGIAYWHQPRGGYFVSVFTERDCAKRVVELCREVGVELTPAGATYPYSNDPADSNIRLAPTNASLEDLTKAMEIFCLAIKLATIEKLLG
jgi:DNA-binding transcriptional MocR family regulator